MGTSGNKQGGFQITNLGLMKNVVRRSWDVIPITDTVIAQVNALSQGQHNDLDLLDQNKHPIGKLNIT